MDKKNNNDIDKKRYKYNAYTIIFHLLILILFFSYGAFKNTLENKNKSRVIEVEIFKEANDAISATTISSDQDIEKILSLEDIKRTFSLEERLDYEIKKEKERAIKAKIEQQKLKEIRQKRLEDIRKKREIDTKKRLKEKKRKEMQKIENEKRKQEEEERIKNEISNNNVKPKVKKVLSKEQYLKTSNGRNDFNNYSSSLYSKVYSKWVKPFNSKTGWNCSLELKQDTQGRVVDIKYIKCNPNNKDLIDSVRQAVVSSSPLPLPNDNRLFDSSVRFTFSVE